LRSGAWPGLSCLQLQLLFTFSEELFEFSGFGIRDSGFGKKYSPLSIIVKYRLTSPEQRVP